MLVLDFLRTLRMLATRRVLDCCAWREPGKVGGETGVNTLDRREAPWRLVVAGAAELLESGRSFSCRVPLAARELQPRKASCRLSRPRIRRIELGWNPPPGDVQTTSKTKRQNPPTLLQEGKMR